MTFAEEIEKVADDETIEAVIVGGFGWSWDESESDSEAYKFGTKTPIPQELKNTVCAWSVVRGYLDYDYNHDYGAPECHAIFAYTKSRVIFVNNYDGSTHVAALPRNPTEGRPWMTGGG